MNTFMKALSACVFMVCAHSTHAAVFEYSGEVVDVSFGSLSGAPTVGEAVTFRISIDDTDPTARFFDTDPTGLDSLLPMLSILTAGGLSASVSNIQVSGSPTVTDTSYSIQTVGAGVAPVPFPNFGSNLHSAGISFDSFAFSNLLNPTVGEFVQALSDTTFTSGSFFAGTQDSETFEFASFSARFETTPVVPLPASGVLLLGALFAGQRVLRKS